MPRALVVVVEVAVAVAAVLVVTVAVAFAGPPTANPTAAPTFSAAFDGTLLRRCVTWCARVLLRQRLRGLRAAHCEASLPEPTWSVCAGAYAAGTLGSNECPTNYTRIEAEGACQIAAAAAGQAYVGSETDSGYPRGCYSFTSSSSSRVYFNMATTGAGQSQSKLLCSGARSLARPSCVLFVYTCGYLCSHPLGSLGCSIEYPIETLRRAR